MRIAIAQLDLKVAAFGSNLRKIRGAVTKARSQGADLVVFSELATVGYPLVDLVEREDLVDRNLDQLQKIAALSDDGLGILVGFVDRNRRGAGKGLHNAAALLWKGRVKGTVRKCLLPTYDVFDEARYFEPGGTNSLLKFKGVRLGVTICEDAWSDPALWDRRLYRQDPVEEAVEAGADILINLSASPFTLGKAELRRDMIRRHAASSGRFFVYVNQVGANDELVFDGHSLIADCWGDVVLRARDFAEDLLVYEIPQKALDGERGTRGAVGKIREVAHEPEEQTLRALVLGLRDYVTKSGFSKVVIGLSGGIDSALVAVLAARALGPENVLGVAMPTRFSSQGSLDDAETLARNLGIDYTVLPIDDIFQSFLDGLAPLFEGTEPDVTEENIQARVRGTALMALSNKFGGLVLATGNKSEVGVGYCTLYGDMCGALAPISDVPKTWVYRLSRWINRKGEVIPDSTLTKPPSAELRPDQTDQDSLPPYEVLDRILRGWVEEKKSVAELVAEGLNPKAVKQVVTLIDANEYKRRQAAPGIKVSSKAFGIGRRYPIVADYSSLHR
ncbi:MAG: NAD+ synthase [Thermoanaerobaculales bacterium]|nr:NAD+ synthase [Thermoanaerobaculales bacterium]